MESVDCSTSPWVSEYWKILGSGGYRFVRLGHSLSSFGASVAASSVTMAAVVFGKDRQHGQSILQARALPRS